MNRHILSVPNPPAPLGWKEVQPLEPRLQRAFFSVDGGLCVIASVDTIDGMDWLHVSASRRSRCPSYEDLARMKRDFIGEDLPAYQVFPKASEHRSLHPYALHLWAPLGADPFPDLHGERADLVAPP